METANILRTATARLKCVNEQNDFTLSRATGSLTTRLQIYHNIPSGSVTPVKRETLCVTIQLKDKINAFDNRVGTLVPVNPAN